MFSKCPRCDEAHLDQSGVCPLCQYSFKVSCFGCGHKNIPHAKFCGNCGKGVTLKIRLKKWFNDNVSYINKFKLKKFAAGFCFGIFLAMFAFGSANSENNETNSFDATQTQMAFSTSQNQSFFSVGALKDLCQWKANLTSSQSATYKDLIKVSNILLKHLKPQLSQEVSPQLESESNAYLKYVNPNGSNLNSLITRGTAALFLYHMAADIFQFSYKDFSGMREFDDIPRFHALSVPVEALETLGVHICKNSNVLGKHENLTIENLFSLANSLLVAGESQVKLDLFNNLEPKI
jgi:ribosomal protein L37E